MAKGLYLVGVAEGAPMGFLGPFTDGDVRALHRGRRELEADGATHGVFRVRAESSEDALRQIEKDLKD